MRHHLWVIFFVLMSFGVLFVHADAVVGNGTSLDCKQSFVHAAVAEGGLITFNCGAAPYTIRITDTLIIRSDTIIDGGGLITLDGIGSTQIFSNNGHQLELRNITLRNGSGRLGGAVHNENGTLIVDNVDFHGNRANAESDGSSVDGMGGAIYNIGSLTITNSRFLNNRAANYGGAIFTTGALFTIENSRFTLNSAGQSGGAIANGKDFVSYPGADGTFINNVFSLNIAGSLASGNGSGGAIHTSGGNLLIQNNFFGANVAYFGGAINTFPMLMDGASLTIESSEFSANLNTAIRSNFPLVVIDTEFIRNRSSSRGGAIDVFGDIPVEILTSSFTGNHARSGGAISNTAQNFLIQDSTLTTNSAEQGGAIYTGNPVLGGERYHSPPVFVVQNSSFVTNRAQDGGSIYISNNLSNGSRRRIQNSTFSANRAERGGAIFDQPLSNGNAAHSSAYATIVEYSTFAHNQANEEGGGAVIYGANGALNLSADIFAYSVGANCNTNFAPVYTVLEYPSSSCGGGSWGGDPLLEPLADNGGPTMTHALMTGSPAIDAVSGPALTSGIGSAEDPMLCGVDVDQRHFARPVNATGIRFALCDVGAYEYLASVLMTGSFPVVQATPEATLVPVPTSIPVIVNCTPFRVTSPLDGLPNGVASFYWDAAPGATSYLVNVINEVGQEVASFSVDASSTTLTGDVSHNAIGSGTNFTWVAKALHNGQIYCSSQTMIPRESPNIPPPPVPQPTIVPGCGNGIQEPGENPNNCPNGY